MMGHPLASFPEIAVVLGGRRHAATRVRAAADLARAHPRLALVVTGRHGLDEPAPAETEAALMRALLVADGIDPGRVFAEDESRDTLANAILTARRYLDGVAPRPLFVVTSAFHLARALAIFRAVLGPAWPLAGVAAADLPGDERRGAQERALAADAERFFDGLAPGAYDAMARRLRGRSRDATSSPARSD